MYHDGVVWRFAPQNSRFAIELLLETEYGYEYYGDDPDGETQAKLDSGEYVAFVATVRVVLDGVEIGADHLGGCVYDANDVSDFWQAHRDPNPLNRCSIMRAARGDNVGICHYFPDMVASAVAKARDWLGDMPRVRK